MTSERETVASTWTHSLSKLGCGHPERTGSPQPAPADAAPALKLGTLPPRRDAMGEAAGLVLSRSVLDRQPFTPPMARPPMIQRWNMRYTTDTGSETRIAKAESVFHGVVDAYVPTIPKRAMVRVKSFE